MHQENKGLCKQFENEVWLYLSEEIDAERRMLWNKHLAECPVCSALLSSNSRISALYKENMSEDLLDSSFDRIIEKAAAKRTLPEKVKYFFAGFGKSFVFGKVIFGSALVTASLIILLFSQRPNPVKQIVEQVSNWEDSTVTSAIEKVSGSILSLSMPSGDKEEEWNNSVDNIENQITLMEEEINQN